MFEPLIDAVDEGVPLQFSIAPAHASLGNTPTVCRESYIDPRVFSLYRKGRTMELGGSKDAAIRRLILGE